MLATLSIRVVIKEGILKHSKTANDQAIISGEVEEIKLSFQDLLQKRNWEENPKLIVDEADIYGDENYGWVITFKRTGHPYRMFSNGNIEKEFQEELVSASQPANIDELSVGDYVNYTYDLVTEDYIIKAKYSGLKSDQTIRQNQTKLKWRILNIDKEKGTVDLISTIPTTQQPIQIDGPRGYHNAVYFMNNICAKYYSNQKLGITARSITIEDIENQMTEAGREKRNATYGQIKTYEEDLYYPHHYAEEKGAGIDTDTPNETGKAQSELLRNEPTVQPYNKAAKKLTVTNTGYSFSKNDGFKEGIANLIFPGESYIVASRCVVANSSSATFAVYAVDSSSLSAKRLGSSYLSESFISLWTSTVSGALCPIVTMNANMIGGGEGTENNPRALVVSQ